MTGSFGDCAAVSRRAFRRIPFAAHEPEGLLREVAPHPFLPRDETTLSRRCWEIFEIQTKWPPDASRGHRPAEARPRAFPGARFDARGAGLRRGARLGRPTPHGHLAVLMPGFGTTPETSKHAERLAKSLGANVIEIGVSEAANLVLRAIEHPAATGTMRPDEIVVRLRERPALGDTTFENVQARLRTLLLMTLANHRGGMMVGTGDLSEKALGWATYAGDHIAMYDVNAGVPKTLIQFVIRWVARERLGTWVRGDRDELKRTLEAILDTPISPELLPPDAEGRIAHLTEASIGPYELHDFFLFHLVRQGARPARILDLAGIAFGRRYPLDELKRWLAVKRSCSADTTKVGMVALSPRADWRMPSDARVRSWLAEAEAYHPA